MAVVIDNNAIQFAEEFRNLCKKYVTSCSLTTIEFNDGSRIGMRTLLLIGMGVKTIEQCISNRRN